MFRLKIKKFKISVDDKVGLEGELPCSLRTVLSASEGVDPRRADVGSGSVEFAGVLEIEPHLLSMKHVCLRLAGISEACEVVLNGKTVSAPDSRERIYVYNVKDRLVPGYNTLVIRFQRAPRPLTGIRLREGDLYDPAIESVTLLAFNGAAINSVNVTETHGEGGVTLNVNMGIIGDKEGVRAVATLVSPTGKIYYSGLVDGQGTITVSDPLLWWPLGMGVPNLYDLAVNLYHGDSAEDVCEMRVGLRELTASYEDGSISVKVGGIPVFLRGLRALPCELGAEFADPETLSHLVTSAAAVGVNALYVSPYGKAASDRFLELCDEHGILVILGVSDKYSDGDSTSDAVKREIVDGPRRISYHPSLAAFYINSEITPNPETLKSTLETYCFGTSAIIAEGEPHRQMPVAVPEERTLREVLSGGEDNVLSLVGESATEPRGALPAAVLGMSAEYKFPLGNRSLSYLSQLANADRLERELTEARAGGQHSFFADRLNDPSPLISSSTIDGFGRWKAAHYALRRLYSPVVVLYDRSGYSITFTVYNDRAKEYSGTLTYRVLDTDNKELYRGSIECRDIAPGGWLRSDAVDLAEYIDGYERERYLTYSYSDGKQTREMTVFFVPRKHFKFKPQSLRATVSGSGKRFDVTLYSDNFVGRVWLGFSSTDALFEENGFDIVTTTPKRVLFETAEVISAERLESELEIITL